MAKKRASASEVVYTESDKSRTIQLACKAGETVDQATAGMLVRGTVANATTIIDYSRAHHLEMSLTDIAQALAAHGDAVNGGDLAALERMLQGQAVALNAMFTELARRGALNMGEHPGAMDRYVRLALKAQSQSRATIETLAAIKNPPVVFARQANINNGGQQQVNNGEPGDRPPPLQPRAGKVDSAPNELLRGRANAIETMDAGAARAAGAANPALEPLEAIHRPANG